MIEVKYVYEGVEFVFNINPNSIDNMATEIAKGDMSRAMANFLQDNVCKEQRTLVAGLVNIGGLSEFGLAVYGEAQEKAKKLHREFLKEAQKTEKTA